MALTNKQKALLHMAAEKLGIDEAQRRIIQQNVGGFFSAADRTAGHEGFCAVMAFYEDRSGGRLAGCTEGYWRDSHAKNAGRVPTHRLIRRIDSEADLLGWTRLHVDNFLAGKHMTSGGHTSVQDAPAYWLRRLLQALIEMNKRGALHAV